MSQKYLSGQPHQLPRHRQTFADYQGEHILFTLKDGVATVSLNRPERKNPLSFESYAELRDLFRNLCYADDVHAIVITGAGNNFCSGGDCLLYTSPSPRDTERSRMPSSA